MWEGIERSPVLAAPSFNTCIGLTATSTINKIGEEDEDIQAANDLCEKYHPLALKIACSYRDRGVHVEDLRSAAFTGLVLASRKFDPNRGAFGPYAKSWVKGEITALFKGNNPLDKANTLTVVRRDDEEGEEGGGHQKDIAAPPPIITPDLTALAEKDRYIIQSRSQGQTLAEIGKALGISTERVRQREARSRSKIIGGHASRWLSDLTKRGNVIRFPHERARQWLAFTDRAPPKNTYVEPRPSQEIARHRILAPRLADLRGNEPLRNARGSYGGPVIHGWGVSR